MSWNHELGKNAWNFDARASIMEVIYTNGDVASAEELAVDVELREGGPAGVLLEPLAERLVGEHVERLEGHVERAQDLHDGVGESALREVLGPLHEQHHLAGPHHLVQRRPHLRAQRRQAPHRPAARGGLRLRGTAEAEAPNRSRSPREQGDPSGLPPRGEGERDGGPGERPRGRGGGGHRGGWRLVSARAGGDGWYGAGGCGGRPRQIN